MSLDVSTTMVSAFIYIYATGQQFIFELKCLYM